MSLIQSTIKDFAKNNISTDSILIKSQTKVKDMLSSVDFCSLENKKKIDEQITNTKVLLNNIDNTLNILNIIKKYNEMILASLTAAKLLISTIKISSLALPSSVPPGVGVPVGVIINSADLLSKTDDKVSLYLGISAGIEAILFSQSKVMEVQVNNLNNLLHNLEFLSSQFKDKCGIDTGKLDNSNLALKSGVSQLKTAIPNKNSEGDNFYKGYNLQILTEETLDNNISLKRRYGVAINPQGLVDFTTNLTYVREDTTIYDELKFQIDKK